MQSRERIDRAKKKAHEYERDYGGCALYTVTLL